MSDPVVIPFLVWMYCPSTYAKRFIINAYDFDQCWEFAQNKVKGTKCVIGRVQNFVTKEWIYDNPPKFPPPTNSPGSGLVP